MHGPADGQRGPEGLAWVAGVLQYLRSNLHRRVPVREVARVARRSLRVVQYAVLRETGLTISANHRRLRMEAVKRALSDGRLSIGSVAASLGFRYPQHFSRVFRNVTGLTPRQYRRLAPSPPTPASEDAAPMRTLVFADDGTAKTLGWLWLPSGGEWKEADGCIEGRGADDVRITLARELPADFLLEIELMRTPSPGSWLARRLVLALVGEMPGRPPGYQVLLGDERSGSHWLRQEGRSVAVLAGDLPAGDWHRVLLGYRGGVLSLALDEKEVFQHREILPPPYRERCRLLVEGWETCFRIRGVRVWLLPAATGNPDALADSRVAEGDFEGALDLYEGALGRSTDANLLFKIATCYARLGLPIRAAAYFERFSAERKGTLWGTVAALEAFAHRIPSLPEDELRREVGRRFEEAASHSGETLVAEFLVKRIAELSNRGDYDRSILLARLVRDASPPLSEPARWAVRSVVDLCVSAGRHEDAVSCIANKLREGNLEPRQVAALRIIQARAFASSGAFRQAEETLAKVAAGMGRYVLAQREIHRGLVLQARGRPEQALRSFRRTERDFADAASQAHTASILSALLLALGGRIDEAEAIARGQMASEDPQFARFGLYLRWSLLAIGGRVEEVLSDLAERTYGREGTERETIRENLLLSLLREIVGETARAARGIEAIEKRFAKGPFRRLVLPASFLLGKASEEDVWRETKAFGLLLPDTDSSTLFYLLGRVVRARGDEAGARRLFRYATKADPLNHWASVLSRVEARMPLPKGIRSFIKRPRRQANAGKQGP